MSITTTAPVPVTRTAAGPSAQPPSLPPVSGIPLARLVRVEIRKQLDTLSGRWMMIAIALVQALAVTIAVFNVDQHSWMTYVAVTTLPMAILLPVIGIMGATSEWSQRTAMTTFAHEPRRGRVVAAKVTGSLLLGLAAYLVCLLLAAGAHQLAISTQGVAGDWSVDGWTVAGGAVIVGIYVLQGSAFGLAALNTPAAIVGYLVLPILLSMLTGMVASLRGLGEWVDLNTTLAPLAQGLAPTGDQWGRVGVSVALWVLLPMLIGIWRVLRREVK